MKKILTIATSAMLLVACSEKPGYEITGTVSNSDLNGKYVYLYEYGVRDAAPLDSALIENGAFKLKGEQAVPVLRVLRFAPDVVEPQRGMPFTATFTLENARLAATLDSTSTVSGTPENDEQNALRDKVKEMSSSFDQLIADMRSGDEERIKEAEEKYEAIDHEITGMVTDYILAHADQPIAAKTLLENQYSIGEKEQDEIIAKASEAFKAVPGINRLVEHLEVLKNVAVGKKFTDFEMADAKGEMHKLSEYVGNGKVVLIDFWASWCGLAVQKCPTWSKLIRTTRRKGLRSSAFHWTTRLKLGRKA